MTAHFPSRTEAGVRYAASMPADDSNDPRIRSLQWVRPGSRVLEIGCGHGAVTRFLRRRLGCDVVAVDVDSKCEQSLAGAASRFVCGDICDQAVQRQIAGRYDYVLLMDVLEHLPSPETVLSSLASIVGPSAAFVITLPNFVVWHVRLPILFGRFAYDETGTLDRTHLRFFSPQSAQQLVSDAGLEIRAIESTWNVPALGNIWSVAQLARLAELEEKVQRRFARQASLVMTLFRAQQTLNRYGWLQLVDAAGRSLLRLAPSLFTNHILLLAEPRQRRSEA